MLSRQDLKPPEGWEWVDDWQVDLGRAVDEDGEFCTQPKWPSKALSL